MNKTLVVALLVGMPWNWARAQVSIPAQADWVDHGLMVDSGPFGAAWDVVFEGITPCAAVKYNGVYYLYYVGADDYIDDVNNIGPSHRSIGLAQSPDGIHWTKHPSNPVITFTSSGNPEEGAVSGGVYVDAGGEFTAYYGANIAATVTTPSVNADGRLATAADGAGFSGQSIVVDHADSGTWGSGDELHAVLALYDGSSWYAYYIPNGSPQAGNLGVSWGPNRSNLSNNGPVLSGGGNVRARGSLSVSWIDADTAAFFISYRGQTDVRTADRSALTQLSAPVESYDFGANSVVLLDTDRNTWFMFYNKWGYMGMRLAPASTPDATPPTAPPGLSAAAPDYDRAALSFGAATDADTGVAAYRIYRGGVLVGSTCDLEYTDLGLLELTTYAYEVRAVNFHQVEGPGGTAGISTPADTRTPGIEAVRAGGDPLTVTVVFDEPVEQSSAEDAQNYTIGGISVSAAVLDADQKTATLTTGSHTQNGLYTLSVGGVLDRAATPNAASARVAYTYSGAAGLVGHWRLDATADDTSFCGNHGEIEGSPATTAGQLGSALRFEGNADYLEIDDSPSLDTSGGFSVSAWVKPEDVPPAGSTTSWAYTIFSGPALFLLYDGNFLARIRTVDGTFELTSTPMVPGAWRHVVMVKDQAAGKLHLYLDGQSVGGSPLDFTGGPPVPYYFAAPEGSTHREYYQKYRIGVSDPLFHYESNYHKGDIDDVRLYDRPLSASEVQDLFDSYTQQPDTTPPRAPANLSVVPAN